ncbi:MAG TPA: ABC transporter [Algoriphagus sp.]|jgi:lipoprotein-releasing system permease protein|uniref:ABC transporter permease n=1 Tax=unclassified Algoriphagus TaxID=2641541 RepID=UPI000C674B0C|nr:MULTISPECIES: ABC transporter permease [unclassified Algoriphagus]MAL12969.1 ABC transporter [Algoriphagus sp.]MAN86297.1 ABC transporter [Algoriphagus sp.]QYH39309.1 ABC transporter permease [Algoriphagus sp. NBT04N3]HAS60945.1 ABC transporter [Algoriphagus sp.]HAZ26661.1 ABC transporter [Algoriphagus sp.]|tara:strand:+ start:2488 stop:3744 length:1257 start_codon:yes stop_codon:yes gene_type:complete
MKWSLIIELSKALMFARIKQTAVAAVGVMFSITMFVALLGFMNGLNTMLDGLVLNRTPHIRFYNEIKPNPNQPIDQTLEFSESLNIIRSIKPSTSRLAIHDAEKIIQTLQADPRVLGVSPKISSQVFFNVGTIDLTGIVNGIDVEKEAQLFAFTDYITSGDYSELAQTNTIILGKGAADRMLADVGDVIQVTTAQGNRIQLKVVGYYQSGLGDFDNSNSFASLTTVQKMLGESPSYVTDIQVKLKDLDLAPDMAKEMEKIFGIDADDIQTVNAQFETGTQIRTLISYAVGITLLVVSGFGIYNILNMMIYEKLDTIAILKAIGFNGTDVNRIFITIALSIGLIGGAFGLILGFLACLGIDQVPFETDALPTIKTFPVDYNPKYYLIGGSFSLITTYLAGFFPARKASSVDPVDIIRGK